MDLALQVCFGQLPKDIPPASVNTYPLVDFISYVSEIQLAS